MTGLEATRGGRDNLLSRSRSDKRGGACGLGDPATPGPNLLWLRHPDRRLSGPPCRYLGRSVPVKVGGRVFEAHQFRPRGGRDNLLSWSRSDKRLDPRWASP
jgi:hypothetical protein